MQKREVCFYHMNDYLGRRGEGFPIEKTSFSSFYPYHLAKNICSPDLALIIFSLVFMTQLSIFMTRLSIFTAAMRHH